MPPPWPIGCTIYYRERPLGEGMAVAVVRETGNRVVGCKCRRVVEVLVPRVGQFKAKAGSPSAAFLDTTTGVLD